MFSDAGYARGAAAYLDRPSHASAAALGKSVTAWTTHLAGLQYNPAILTATESFHLVGSYVFLTDDRTFISANSTFSFRKYLVFDVGCRRLSVGNIEQRDKYGYYEGLFGDYEYAVEIACAGRAPKNISWGGRARYLHQQFKGLKGISTGYGNGIGFDIGLSWHPVRRITLGVSGLNLGAFMWWGTGRRDMVVPQGRLGVAGLFFHERYIAEIDIVKALWQPPEVSFGMQYTLFDILSIRAGCTTSIDIYDRHYRQPDISFGVGIRYQIIGCDYAIIVPFDHTRDMISHLVSLVMWF
jgi:hypothetical protein